MQTARFLDAFEVALDAVPQPKAKAGRARPLLRLATLQPVERDFAFLVESGVEAEKLVRAIRGTAKEIAAQASILSVSVFDVYEGKGLPEGRKSIAVAVRWQRSSYSVAPWPSATSLSLVPSLPVFVP